MTLTSEITVEKAFIGLERVFQPENTVNIDAIVQFELIGEGGVEFFATLRNQAMKLEIGHAPSSKVKMSMPAEDFLAMLDGTLSTTDAFTSGKLKVGGNLIYAMKLATVFKFGAPGQ
jgi:putative sterol carrier protein